MKTRDIIKKGNLNIGYVSDYFLEKLGNAEVIEKRELVSHTTKRYMSDAEITKEFNVQDSSAGDVVHFLENPTAGTSDGNWNLFYFPDFVVFVYWYAGGGEWGVYAWGRGSFGWSGGGRVFSPATAHSNPHPSSSPMTLPDTLEINGEMYKRV